jgi:hypothetical protein
MRNTNLGQSSMEYVVVCAAFALILGIGMWSDESVLKMLIEAFKQAFRNIAFVMSLPF